MLVIRTIQICGAIIRYRKCEKCAHEVATKESIS